MTGRLLSDELVDGIRDQSDTAFAAVHRLLRDELFSYAYGMLRDRGAAEDAVQQAFLELTRAAPALRGDGRSLRAWLYRSVRFNCLDEVRRRRRHPELPTDPVPEPPFGEIESGIGHSLREGLLGLPERQRTILLLRYVLDLGFDEIARITGTTRAGAYATCGRARRALQREVAAVENAARMASFSSQEARSSS